MKICICLISIKVLNLQVYKNTIVLLFNIFLLELVYFFQFSFIGSQVDEILNFVLLPKIEIEILLQSS